MSPTALQLCAAAAMTQDTDETCFVQFSALISGGASCVLCGSPGQWTTMPVHWRVTHCASPRLRRLHDLQETYPVLAVVLSASMAIGPLDPDDDVMFHMHRGSPALTPTTAAAGVAGCSCVEVQLARARAEGVKDSKLEKMRPACASSCHRFRLKGAWAMRVNRGGKVVEKSKCKGAADAVCTALRALGHPSCLYTTAFTMHAPYDKASFRGSS